MTQKTLLDGRLGLHPRSLMAPTLVAYDIADGKRRHALFRILRGFGVWKQGSVFLCWLDPDGQSRLRRELEAFAALPHQGTERIDCLPIHSDAVEAPMPRGCATDARPLC